jgi:single-strand DNA-binding protein
VDGQPTAHNCKLLGRGAENIVKSVAKGDRVLVHGEVITETWEDRETAEKRYRDVVIVEEIGASLRWTTTRTHRNSASSEDSAAE